MKTQFHALTLLSALLLTMGASFDACGAILGEAKVSASTSDGGTIREESEGNEDAGAPEDQESAPDAIASESPADGSTADPAAEPTAESDAASGDASESGDESGSADSSDGSDDGGDDDSDDDTSDDTSDDSDDE